MAEDVRAEIVASVLEVVVREGDQIGEGDTVVLLESMKMEIPVLAEVAGRPDIFVNPYLVEVQERTPSGRDRLKERIRSAGPTVGHSLDPSMWRENA